MSVLIGNRIELVDDQDFSSNMFSPIYRPCIGDTHIYTYIYICSSNSVSSRQLLTILHQLIGDLPLFVGFRRVSTIQGGARFLPSMVSLFFVMADWLPMFLGWTPSPLVAIRQEAFMEVETPADRRSWWATFSHLLCRPTMEQYFYRERWVNIAI